MEKIRQARMEDAARIAEIEIFNYRMNFYPIFKSDWFYFEELQVPRQMERYKANPALIENTLVYDDGVVKGFVRVKDGEVEKLFVEPVLQGKAIGAELLEYAIQIKQANFLWALEKNARAIAFYQRNGFCLTGDKKLEEDTTEYLVRMQR